MILVYILFFLLERRYVKKCIWDFLVVYGYYKWEEIFKNKVSEIVSEMIYYVKDVEIFFVYGCKRV